MAPGISPALVTRVGGFFEYAAHPIGKSVEVMQDQITHDHSDTAVARMAPTPRYDRWRLKEDIAAETAGIRALKRIIHQPHTPGTALAQAALAGARRRATVLCSVAAELHGHAHLTRRMPAYEQARVDLALVEYTL
jgi:hypothetical protein